VVEVTLLGKAVDDMGVDVGVDLGVDVADNVADNVSSVNAWEPRSLRESGG
jgi:hypothetical protein